MNHDPEREQLLIVYGGIIAVLLVLALVGKYIFSAIGLGINIAIHGAVGAGIAISSVVLNISSISISILAVGTTVYTFQRVVEKARNSKYKYDAFVPIFSVLGGLFTAMGKEAFPRVLNGKYDVLLLSGAFALVYAMAGILIKQQGVSSKVAATMLYVIPPAALLSYALKQSHALPSLSGLASLPLSTQISASLLVLLTIVGLLLAYRAGKSE